MEETHSVCLCSALQHMPCIMSGIVLFSSVGHLNVVKFLINEAHCDPDVKDNDGSTPLHRACR